MGVSTNPPVFLPDKDSAKPNMDLEFGLRGMKFRKEECKTSTPEDHHQFMRLKKLSVQECEQEEDKDGQEKERISLSQNYNIIVPVPVTPTLRMKKLEIPAHEVPENDDDDDSSNDGFKTPTSSDHKIPPMRECPGAPRKKITRTSPTKRKAACCRRLVFELSKEVESIFSMSFMEDLAGASDKNKKLKNCI